MAKAKGGGPIAEILALESKATSRPVKIRLSDLDLTPSIYYHRDASIYLYKADDDGNQARKLVESLVVAGQTTPIAYCIENGKKVILCGHRRLEACRTAIEMKLDPERFHPAMELDALEISSPDPKDLLEWSITDNEVRVGLTEAERDIAVGKMLAMGFSATRAAKCLGMSATQFHRIRRRLGSPVMMTLIQNGDLTATDVDSLLEEAKGNTPRLEQDITEIVAQVQAHISDKRADAASRQEEFNEDKHGKVRNYLKPSLIKGWVKDLKEGRSIDWVAEPEAEGGWTYECSLDVKTGKIKIANLTGNIRDMEYANFAQVCAKIDLLSKQLTALFLKQTAIRQIEDLDDQTQEGQGVIDYYRRHQAGDLAAKLERQVAQARGELDPEHGKVAPRREQSIAASIQVPPPTTAA